MPVAAIVLICIGCAMILGGLVYVALKARSLMKAAHKAGINNMADVQEIIGRVQRLEPRFRELERNQAALAESLQRLQAEAEVLNYLREQLVDATGTLTSFKS
jgi:cell division FtsZ-interacting protein ZapD